MSRKQIFIWAVIVGIALAGGIDGVITLLLWVAAFWLLEKAYDGVAAFARGWKTGRAERLKIKQPTRPKLYVVK